jgi:hypothetical protein
VTDWTRLPPGFTTLPDEAVFDRSYTSNENLFDNDPVWCGSSALARQGICRSRRANLRWPHSVA